VFFALNAFGHKLRGAMPSAPEVTTDQKNEKGVDLKILRWVALAWVAAWTPIYWHEWGWQNFFHFCDAAVFLTCVGLWTRSALLISSQAVNVLVASGAWLFEVGWRLVAGRGLFGGADYLWDAHVALWIRLLTFFHVLVPIVLIYAITKIGYDRRGFALQCAIAAVLLIAGRLMGAQENMNFAFFDPVFHRAFGPAPLHLIVILAGTIVLTYLPAHLLFVRFAPQSAAYLRG
jgi:hypothetical protein